MDEEQEQSQEVIRTTYTWSDFNLESAKVGALVGFPSETLVGGVSTPNLSDSKDIGKKTGRLVVEKVIKYSPYSVTINGIQYWVDEEGKVLWCNDAQSIGKYLRICTASMVSTAGSKQPTTRAGGAEYQDVLAISSLDVRDTFAIYALQGLLKHCDQPQSYDDANILSVCAAAYRWAQGMMQASADAKALVARQQESGEGSGEGGGEQGGSGVTRSSVDVTDGTNSEKLLNNIVKAVDDLTTQVTAINTSLQGTIKIDNPANDTFEVEGGGGSSNINEVLKYSTTPRKTCKNYIGFWKDENNQWFIGENTVEGLTTQIEAAQLVATNNSPYLWLRKSGDTVINDISTFLSVYSQDICDAQASNWREDIKTALVTALNKLDVDNADVDAANAIANVSALWI